LKRLPPRCSGINSRGRSAQEPDVKNRFVMNEISISTEDLPPMMNCHCTNQHIDWGSRNSLIDGNACSNELPPRDLRSKLGYQGNLASSLEAFETEILLSIQTATPVVLAPVALPALHALVHTAIASGDARQDSVLQPSVLNDKDQIGVSTRIIPCAFRAARLCNRRWDRSQKCRTHLKCAAACDGECIPARLS
jgi:hypothetical protein